jgi:RNA polymerase sigma-70 factor (ECF subfamily)
VVRLFEQFRAPLLRYLLSWRIPPDEGEEIVQEVFLLLYRRLRDGQPKGNLAGWLFGAAHKFALKNRGASGKRSSGFRADDAEAVVDEQYPGPEERFELIERRERLLSVVSALPAHDRLCLCLRAEGLRYREIASVLGVSLGSVANSLARTLGRLTRAAGF